MATHIDPSVLSGVALFSGIPEAELPVLLELADQITLSAGESLFQEDEPADAFYVLLSGGIDLFSHGNRTDESFLAHLTAGAVIGETSLLVDKQHSASARASEPSTLLRFVDQKFLDLLDAGDVPALRVVANLARVLAARLRAADDHIVELAAKQASDGAQEDDLDRLRRIFFTDWSL